MLVGKSVHNQRIERLWRDVYVGVIKFYHDLFLYMEAIGVLDPDDETTSSASILFIFHASITILNSGQGHG